MTKVDIDEWLDKIGGFVTGAFGPKFALGMLIGLMDEITPIQCYEFIRDKKDLFPDLTDDDWVKVSDFVKRSRLQDIEVEQVREQFRKRRSDLLQVVVNHPDGEAWLENQVNRLRYKLGLQ